MSKMKSSPVVLSPETDFLVQDLFKEKMVRGNAIVDRTIEQLRRLAEEATLSGASPQTMQKISSALRLLGDRTPMSRKSLLAAE